MQKSILRNLAPLLLRGPHILAPKADCSPERARLELAGLHRSFQELPIALLFGRRCRMTTSLGSRCGFNAGFARSEWTHGLVRLADSLARDNEHLLQFSIGLPAHGAGYRAAEPAQASQNTRNISARAPLLNKVAKHGRVLAIVAAELEILNVQHVAF